MAYLDQLVNPILAQPKFLRSEKRLQPAHRTQKSEGGRELIYAFY